MNFWAGADGGQSGTALVVGDEHGRVVARVRGGPCFYGDGRTVAQRCRFLEDLARDAASEAGVPDTAAEPFNLKSIVAGVSGIDRPSAWGPAHSVGIHFRHDSDIAHTGAFGGTSGVVVIAGSGSVALGIQDARHVRLGGWGYLFGDEGSAFWMGRSAVTTAMRAMDAHHDGAPPPGSTAEELTRLIVHCLGVGNLREVQHGFTNGTLGRAQIAALAKPLVAYAQHYPRSSAAEIVALALALLRELAVETAARLEMPGGSSISYAGGVFSDAWFAREFMASIPAPHRAKPPMYPPEVGALIETYRNNGISIDPREPRS